MEEEEEEEQKRRTPWESSLGSLSAN